MMYKETIENKCKDCGEDAIAVKVARTKTNRQGGIFWKCAQNHMNRTRKYKVVQIKVG